MRKSEWILKGREESVEELAPHIVSRVGTVLRNHCDRYDGVTVRHGNVVFGAAHESHLVSVILGPDDHSGRLGIRILSHGNAAAKYAAAAFPLTMLVSVLGAAKSSVPGGALVGLFVGMVAGLVAAYGVFNLVNRLGVGARGDSGRTAAISQGLKREIQRSLSSLEMEMTPGPIGLAGLDGNPTNESTEAWGKIFGQAVTELAG
jgi:hypothetical protein